MSPCVKALCPAGTTSQRAKGIIRKCGSVVRTPDAPALRCLLWFEARRREALIGTNRTVNVSLLTCQTSPPKKGRRSTALLLLVPSHRIPRTLRSGHCHRGLALISANKMRRQSTLSRCSLPSSDPTELRSGQPSGCMRYSAKGGNSELRLQPPPSVHLPASSSGVGVPPLTHHQTRPALKRTNTDASIGSQPD